MVEQTIAMRLGDAWSANSVLAGIPLRGFASPNFQVQGFDIRVDWTMTESGGTETTYAFASEAERFAWLDSILSRVTISSGSMGELIDAGISMSQLVQATYSAGIAHPVGEDWQVPGTTIAASAAGTKTGRTTYRLRFASQHDAIRSYFCPSLSQFEGGVIQVTCGSGAACTIGTKTWQISSATVSISVVGREPPPGVSTKASPLRLVQFTDTGAQFNASGKSGLLFHALVSDTGTTTYNPATLVAAGATAAQYQLKIDGRIIQQQTGSDPESVKRRAIADGPHPALYAQQISARPVDSAGAVLVSTGDESTPDQVTLLEDRLQIDFGSAWGVGAKTVLAWMALPIESLGGDCAGGTPVSPDGAGDDVSSRFYARVMD